jgi:hypothetical protein
MSARVSSASAGPMLPQLSSPKQMGVSHAACNQDIHRTDSMTRPHHKQWAKSHLFVKNRSAGAVRDFFIDALTSEAAMWCNSPPTNSAQTQGSSMKLTLSPRLAAGHAPEARGNSSYLTLKPLKTSAFRTLLHQQTQARGELSAVHITTLQMPKP